ncbi:hypothetical protein C4J81_14825 [Deltaproteobacteria bacterium Smac51]|nr:hypothetical protein C4J81_14825 [Deltaproteobacteria bacterium Smac51]
MLAGKSKSVLAILLALALTALLAASAAGTAERRVIVMLGDSLTAGNDWTGSFPSSRYPHLKIHNMGISGNTTIDIIRRLDEVIALKPDSIFFQAGINDFGATGSRRGIVERHKAIWRELRESLPGVRIQVISLLPLAEEKYPGINAKIRDVNVQLKEEAEKSGLVFIDLYRPLADSHGSLPDDFTFDGVHLKAPAYERWIEAIRPYI